MTLHTRPGSKADRALDLLNKMCFITIIGMICTTALLYHYTPAQAVPLHRQVIWIEPEQVPRVAKYNPLLPTLKQVESAGDTQALSPKGAAGAYQIMPATARKPGFGVTPLRWWDGKDPRTAPYHEQKRFANDYLNAIQALHGGNRVLAAASYNAGPNAVLQAKRTARGNLRIAVGLLPTETKVYVRKVAGYQQVVSSAFDILEK